MNHIGYISGVITDGFALCEDLRFYLKNSLSKGKLSLRVAQSSNKVYIESPVFKSIDAHYVCLVWDSNQKKINFVWRNDEGEIKTFDTLIKLAEDIENSIINKED